MKKRIILLILSFVLLYAVGGVFYNVYYKDSSSTNKKVTTNIDSIKNYTYTLSSNATALQKTEFKSLKTNLEGSKINYEEYAKSIAKMFIIDLYTINNKINKYDVGGISFVYPDSLINYKANVEDTIYKYVEDNSDGKRTQILPEVSNIAVDSFETTKYKIGEKTYDGYKIKLSWNDIKDLDYEKSGEVMVIKKDNYLYIVQKN